MRVGSTDWTCFEAPLGLRMRNSRGDPMRHDLPETEAALFTMEQIPAGTRFDPAW